MELLLLLIYARLDGKMERNGLNNVKLSELTYPEMSISCCLCVVYVLFMFCLCVVYVLSICCLCVV